MTPRRKPTKARDPRVRKSLMVDAHKLARARRLLHASSDADVLRLALDRLLRQYEDRGREEE